MHDFNFSKTSYSATRAVNMLLFGAIVKLF